MGAGRAARRGVKAMSWEVLTLLFQKSGDHSLKNCLAAQAEMPAERNVSPRKAIGSGEIWRFTLPTCGDVEMSIAMPDAHRVSPATVSPYGLHNKATF